MAVFLLVAAAALQAFCYAGFHSYVQDVAAKVRNSDHLLHFIISGTVPGCICPSLGAHCLIPLDFFKKHGDFVQFCGHSV